MKFRILALAVLPASLIGCEVDVAAPRAVVVQPAPVVVDPAPVYVEEGAVVGGVVIAPAPVDSYVLIGGDWYYWHPAAHCWVHAHRARDWRPGGDVRVYHGWGEHPMYERRRDHH